MTSQGRQIMNPKSNLVTWYHTSKCICRSDTKMYWLTLSHWFVSSSCVNHTSKHNRLKCTVCARRPTHRHTTASPVGRPAAAAVMTDGRCTTGNALTEHTQSPGSSSGLPWSSHCDSENLTHQRVWEVMLTAAAADDDDATLTSCLHCGWIWTARGRGCLPAADWKCTVCVCVCVNMVIMYPERGGRHTHTGRSSQQHELSACCLCVRVWSGRGQQVPSDTWYCTHTRARDL